MYKRLKLPSNPRKPNKQEGQRRRRGRREIFVKRFGCMRFQVLDAAGQFSVISHDKTGFFMLGELSYNQPCNARTQRPRQRLLPQDKQRLQATVFTTQRKWGEVKMRGRWWSSSVGREFQTSFLLLLLVLGMLVFAVLTTSNYKDNSSTGKREGYYATETGRKTRRTPAT